MKEKEVLGGFSAVFDSISTNTSGKGYKDFSEEEEIVETEEIDNDDDIEDEKIKGDDPEEDKVIDTVDTKVDTEIKSDDSNQISLLFQAIAEGVGVDVSEDELPKTTDELLGYINAIVDDKSKPSYASEEVKEIDEFVRNGGNIEDYFAIGSELDYDSLDVTDDFTQKQVVREFLSKKGFSDKQIQRKLEKYEDADILEDEAVDALESLKEIAKEEKKALLEGQKIYSQKVEQEQQKFYQSVVSEIEGLSEVRGVPVPKEDAKALIDYIFKVEADGKTKYQKDYAKSTKNLIESAYFTMKGDSLVKSAKQKGETSAVEKFKNSLKGNKVGGTKQTISSGPSKPLWSLVSSQLTQK